jgi:hypothetical protein
MTKLDEAVEAAIKAGAPGDTYVRGDCPVYADDGTTTDGFMIDGALDMKAAIQAAVKVLVGPMRWTPEYGWQAVGVEQEVLDNMAFNRFRAEILKNAEIDG